MLTTTIARQIDFFYPLRTGRAICLTQDLPCGKDATVLLLGCGDARNVLFTSHVDEGLGASQLDITCCDLEPAILARNLLLYTLIVDDENDQNHQSIWCIYFHFYVDELCLEYLRTHCIKLLSTSSSVEAWNDGKYGRHFRFCDTRTFENVTKLWKFYAAVDATEQELSERAKVFDNGIQMSKKLKAATGLNRVPTGIRSAAPLASPASEELPFLQREFWEHGSTEAMTGIRKTNPMFESMTKESLTIHYDTDPFPGFHLAAAYAPLTSTSPLNLTSTTTTNGTSVLKSARLQFREWSKSFRKSVRRNLILRFFNGEALALCHTLRYLRTNETAFSANLYSHGWTFQPLVLDGGDYAPDRSAPTIFDVIDTSNLADRVGILNLIVAAAPLLKPGVSSILYTEVLVQRPKDPTMMLDGLLYGHFETISMLFGLYPVEYWANATSVASTDVLLFDILIRKGTKEEDQNDRLGSRLIWRNEFPSRGLKHGKVSRKLHFESNDLARLLYTIYQGMFCHEDMAISSMALTDSLIHERSQTLYNRASFVACLRFVKSRIEADWALVMKALLRNIQEDPNLALRRDYFQELHLYLHIFGLHTDASLHLDLEYLRQTVCSSPIFGWKHVPPMVCITFVVPQSNLEFFASMTPSASYSPAFACILGSQSSASDQTAQKFAAMQVGFGKLEASGPKFDENTTLCVVEDNEGWQGKSDLVVAFLVPSWLIMQDAAASAVALELQGTLLTAEKFVPKLGLGLRVFETTISNNVFITKYPPGQTDYATIGEYPDTVAARPSKSFEAVDINAVVQVRLDYTSKHVVSLVCRANFVSQKSRTILARNPLVEARHRSPFLILLAIGKNELQCDFHLPVPVTTRAQIQVAHVLGYVEIVASVVNPLWMRPYADSQMPLSMPSHTLVGTAPINWNMPHLRLDCLPVIDTPQASEMRWLKIHTSLMCCSKRELSIRDDIDAGNGDSNSLHQARVAFKRSLFAMFRQFSGVEGQSTKFFGLKKTGDVGVDVLIFVSALKLHLGTQTVVLDGAALILTQMIAREPSLRQFMKALKGMGDMGDIKAENGELRIWKSNLPAYAERCRTWQHEPRSCQYSVTSEAHPHQTLEDFDTTLCACGKGKIPANFMTGVRIPHVQRILERYATRVAISPCFSVPYVEDCLNVDLVPDSGNDQPQGAV